MSSVRAHETGAAVRPQLSERVKESNRSNKPTCFIQGVFLSAFAAGIRTSTGSHLRSGASGLAIAPQGKGGDTCRTRQQQEGDTPAAQLFALQRLLGYLSLTVCAQALSQLVSRAVSNVYGPCAEASAEDLLQTYNQLELYVQPFSRLLTSLKRI